MAGFNFFVQYWGKEKAIVPYESQVISVNELSKTYPIIVILAAGIYVILANQLPGKAKAKQKTVFGRIVQIRLLFHQLYNLVGRLNSY